MIAPGVATKADYPFVQPVKRRNGSLRYFFRRKGYPRARLPGEPGSPEFIEAYAEAMKGRRPAVAPRSKAAAGTMAALIEEYGGSTEFSRLATLTRREMGYVLKNLIETNGDAPIAKLERKHILRWRDQLKDRPGASNKFLRTIKVLLSFAAARGYRGDNPASAIKVLKLGTYRAWTAEEQGKFVSTWPIGRLERTGFALALYTGQRRADLCRLSFGSIAEGTIRLTQQKTGAVLAIPIHPELRQALPAIYPNDHSPILAYVENGKRKPYNPISFGSLMADAIAAAELPDDCVLHGLRKSAAVALIDAGCTPHQAAAITGHKSARMLEEYARDRDQAKLGRDAMKKWSKAKR